MIFKFIKGLFKNWKMAKSPQKTQATSVKVHTHVSRDSGFDPKRLERIRSIHKQAEINSQSLMKKFAEIDKDPNKVVFNVSGSSFSLK